MIYTFRCRNDDCRMPYAAQPAICHMCGQSTAEVRTEPDEPYDDGRVFNGYTSTNPENNGSGRDGY